MIFSTVFDRIQAPRSIEASASVDSASKNDVRFLEENIGRASKKNVRVPKTAMRRF